jgi:hypothetical protein
MPKALDQGHCNIQDKMSVDVSPHAKHLATTRSLFRNDKKMMSVRIFLCS